MRTRVIGADWEKGSSSYKMQNTREQPIGKFGELAKSSCYTILTLVLRV